MGRLIVIWFEKENSLSVAACSAGKRKSRAVCGQSGQLLIPQLMPWRDPEFPHYGEGDLPNSASFLSAK